MSQGMGLSDLFAGIRAGAGGFGNGLQQGAAAFAAAERDRAKREAEAALNQAKIAQDAKEEQGRNDRSTADREATAAAAGLRRAPVMKTIAETPADEQARIKGEGEAALAKQQGGTTPQQMTDRERAALRINSGDRASSAMRSLQMGLPGPLAMGLEPWAMTEIGNSLADADKLGGVRNEQQVGEQWVRDPALAKPTKATTPPASAGTKAFNDYRRALLNENSDLITKMNVDIPALGDPNMTPAQKVSIKANIARSSAASMAIADADAGFLQLTPQERTALEKIAAEAPPMPGTTPAPKAPPAGELEGGGDDEALVVDDVAGDLDSGAPPAGESDEGIDLPGVGRVSADDVAKEKARRSAGDNHLIGFQGGPTSHLLDALANLSSMPSSSSSPPPSPGNIAGDVDPARIVGDVNGEGKLRGVTPFSEGEHVPDMSNIDDLEGLNFSRSRAGKPDVGVAEEGATGLDDLPLGGPFTNGEFDDDMLRQIMGQQPLPQALAGGIENLKGDDVVDDDSGYRNARSGIMRDYQMTGAPEDAQRALLSLLDDSPPEGELLQPTPKRPGEPNVGAMAPPPGRDDDGTALFDPTLRGPAMTVPGTKPNGGASFDKLGSLLGRGKDALASIFGDLVPDGVPEAQASSTPPSPTMDIGNFDPSMMPADPNDVGDDGFVDLSTIGLSGRAAPRMAGALSQAMAELNPAEQQLLAMKLQGGGAARTPERQQQLYEDDQFAAMAGESRSGAPVAGNGATDGRHGWTGEFQRGLDQPIDRDVHSGHRGGLGLDLNGLPPRIKQVLAKYGIKEMNAGHAGHFEIR